MGVTRSRQPFALSFYGCSNAFCCPKQFACRLFVYFSFRFSRGKLQGRTSARASGAAGQRGRKQSPSPSHATTVSSNFQLESLSVYLAPNERRLPPLPTATLAICSRCGQRILQWLHTKKKYEKKTKFQGIIVVIIIKTCSSPAKSSYQAQHVFPSMFYASLQNFLFRSSSSATSRTNDSVHINASSAIIIYLMTLVYSVYSVNRMRLICEG